MGLIFKPLQLTLYTCSRKITLSVRAVLHPLRHCSSCSHSLSLSCRYRLHLAAADFNQLASSIPFGFIECSSIQVCSSFQVVPVTLRSKSNLFQITTDSKPNLFQVEFDLLALQIPNQTFFKSNLICWLWLSNSSWPRATKLTELKLMSSGHISRPQANYHYLEYSRRSLIFIKFPRGPRAK